MRRHSKTIMSTNLFMIIKNIIVLKKLSGEEAWAFANGDELMNSLEPGWTGYSCNRLNTYRDILQYLEDSNLIKFRARLEPGQGEDEQYWLTPIALNMLEDHKGNEALREAVYQTVWDTL